MRASDYVGRVGSLAVALGIGTALATGIGPGAAVAFADVRPSAATSAAASGAPGGSAVTGTPATAGKDVKTGKPAKAPKSQKPEKAGASDKAGAADDGAADETPSKPAKTPRKGKSAAGAQASSPKAKPSTSGTPTSSTPDATTAPANSTKTKTPAAKTPAAKTKPAAARADTNVSASAKVTAVTPAADTTTTAAATTTLATTTPAAKPAEPARTGPLTLVGTVVTGMLKSVLAPLAGSTNGGSPAQSPAAWSVLAFARREIEGVLALATGQLGAATGRLPSTTGQLAAPTGAVGTTAPSANPAAGQTPAQAPAQAPSLATFVARLAAAVVAPAFPTPGQAFSPSTSFVQWVTGNVQTGNPLIADTLRRFGIAGTDVGTMWDNGMVDDPTTPYDEHQILMAFGDTFSGANMSGVWRFNVLLRSADHQLSDGVTIPNGEWFNGNMFGGTPLSNPTFARQIIHPDGLPAGVTLIPTAGVSVPTPGTQFGVTQYLSFMSVSKWGAAGHWNTNYSAIAYSTDNGENWTVAPSSVRYNKAFGGNAHFQQSAYVRPGDGYVYTYATPNGRQGQAYLARVPEKDILNLTKYEYYTAAKKNWKGVVTPASWQLNKPSAATPIFGADKGAGGRVAPGNQVSEMSVQYSKTLGKYVALHCDRFNNVVMRTSDTPEGAWSAATVLMPQQQGGIYAPMLHPWSPSILGTGTDLYWNLSLFSEYDVMLMKTDVTKL